MRPTHTCLVCGWEWHPRFATPPLRCPKCLSSRWSEEPQVVSRRRAKARKDYRALRARIPD